MGRSADGTVMVASESVALEGSGHVFERNIEPGEAVFIDLQGNVHSMQCAEAPTLNPCIFEFVYLARPDSVLDGISVSSEGLNSDLHGSAEYRANTPPTSGPSESPPMLTTVATGSRSSP